MPHAAASVGPINAVPSDVPFSPPRVEVGQVVLWSYGPTAAERPAPAVVRQVSEHTLNVTLFVDGVIGGLHKTGVRHADDPFLRSMPGHASGCWRLTPRDERLNALLEAYGHSEEE